MLSNAKKDFDDHDLGDLIGREHLALQISELVDRLDSVLGATTKVESLSPRKLHYLKARTWLKRQNARYKYLPKNILKDPAWNILIDMYVQEHEGRAVSVSSACLASGAPPSTGLRWITCLEDSDLITRISDTADGRRVFVRLTPNGRRSIESWLSEVN